jgi:hypothetical protein
MDAVVPQDVRYIAYGQVVWLWSPDAGIKSVGDVSRATEARKPGLRREHEVSRKPIAQGVPDDFGVPVVACVRLFLFCTQGNGCGVHPAFPAPSVFERDEVFAKLGRESRRGNADARHCDQGWVGHRPCQSGKKSGGLRGACHRARVRATRWLTRPTIASGRVQDLFQLRKHLLPSGIGAAERLPLIRPEAGLLHA